ncbi:MAG: helix-turn-helix transcriptional regulator [Clostridia bacterium]|nr:helix-turn-helix transcriptional regulator [Clostridia bacterium]
MFINKSPDNSNNLIGKTLSILRKKKKLSQRAFADKLQIEGLEIDKNAIQRIESGKRFVTDIELVVICRALETTPNQILSDYFTVNTLKT